MINMQNVTFRYSKRSPILLKDLSLTIEQGSSVALLGRSGSGKTTLSRLLLGLIKPTEGNIIIKGEVATKASKGVGQLVHQYPESSLNSKRSIVESVEEPLLRLGLSRIERVRQVREMLLDVGLDESFLYRHPHQLSGGQLQRVCIARALVAKPAFVVLDEVVNRLDVQTKVTLLDLLRELRHSHQLTYLFVTHDVTSAKYTCDTIYKLENGAIQLQ
ncbi:ABC transporter ATP-binding protein [Geomicrobium sediminis]|uniref:Nickel transport system ATP-binding protein n=1 Tax=Geomicrobium sediminis TaxID=1347788 RepID=A0ABS2PJ02_9BACL|nr:ATP-binding cassette domain-containing protein [Geomicrobium sediminis]MBM7635005.1 nickel transport system ATP-binding protein [Geomicrobium sediminis]